MCERYLGDHAGGGGEDSAGFDVFPDWDSALSYSVNCVVANGYAEKAVQRAAARLPSGLLGSDRDVCVSRAGRLLVEGLLRGDVFEPTLDHAGERELVFCWIASCVRDVLGVYAARLINCLVAPPGFGKSLENMLGEDVYLNRARMYVLESGGVYFNRSLDQRRSLHDDFGTGDLRDMSNGTYVGRLDDEVISDRLMELKLCLLMLVQDVDAEGLGLVRGVSSKDGLYGGGDGWDVSSLDYDVIGSNYIYLDAVKDSVFHEHYLVSLRVGRSQVPWGDFIYNSGRSVTYVENGLLTTSGLERLQTMVTAVETLPDFPSDMFRLAREAAESVQSSLPV